MFPADKNDKTRSSLACFSSSDRLSFSVAATAGSSVVAEGSVPLFVVEFVVEKAKVSPAWTTLVVEDPSPESVAAPMDSMRAGSTCWAEASSEKEREERRSKKRRGEDDGAAGLATARRQRRWAQRPPPAAEKLEPSPARGRLFLLCFCDWFFCPDAEELIARDTGMRKTTEREKE